MEKKYYKLVRDRIPDIIRESGNECETAVLSDEEYRQALRQKLIEEAAEVAQAKRRENRGGFAQKIMLLRTF
ncbi:MAG: hypothetical protein EAZ88_03705 [Oscillatoriales cyanobacterium]|nr:MAG: hypothetical protein EAZ88_03705 [Oscillatoriales cyanobacterium]